MERDQNAPGHQRAGHSIGPRDSPKSGGASARSDCAMMTSIAARRLITADAPVEHPRIAIHSDGTIASIEAGEPGDEETMLTPAFFDIHVHGAAGHDAMEGTPQALARIGALSCYQRSCTL